MLGTRAFSLLIRANGDILSRRGASLANTLMDRAQRKASGLYTAVRYRGYRNLAHVSGGSTGNHQTKEHLHPQVYYEHEDGATSG